MGKVILFVAMFAAVVYFLFWTFERRRLAGPGGAGRVRGERPTRRPSPPRTVAPDDDPDFLWRLDQERRRREHDGDES